MTKRTNERPILPVSERDMQKAMGTTAPREAQEMAHVVDQKKDGKWHCEDCDFVGTMEEAVKHVAKEQEDMR